jgi:adenylylsulfate kinase
MKKFQIMTMLIAKAREGKIVVASLISPYAKSRAHVRGLCRNFVEVYVSTPLSTCEERDRKGLYKKARAGEIKQFTGIDSPYEAPEKPEINLLTANRSVEECAQEVINWLQQNNYIPAEEPALSSN